MLLKYISTFRVNQNWLHFFHNLNCYIAWLSAEVDWSF